MIASLMVKIGVEVDLEEARNVAKKVAGSEYTDELPDEECINLYVESKFSQGLGYDVEVLGIG